MSEPTGQSRVLYLDAASGAAGDMILAALVHAGADLEAITNAVHRVVGDHVVVKTSDCREGAITGLNLRVTADEQEQERSAREILEAIAGAGLPDRILETSRQVFSALAVAEGRIHGVEPEEVHFHEVGAIDSIVDVVGIAAALDDLDIDSVFSSPLPMTRGHVKTRHGLMPIPAPATLEVLKGFPIVGTDMEGEFVTPTGAAVCATLAGTGGPPPPMRIESVGYGFGTRKWPDGRPNCVRALVGRLSESIPDPELEISANIDDMSPDDVSHLVDTLFEAGALDAWVTPVLMKKGRPAWVISAVTSASCRAPIESAFFEESTTIGVRIQPLERVKLQYRIHMVSTSLGNVRVKRAFRDGKVVNQSLESDDLRRVAKECGLSLKQVKATILREIPL